jgi:hypothetical protein
MKALMRTQIILGSVLLLVGIGFVCLPDTWIESTFGIDPDGGNGWIEALLAAAPIAAGVLLLLAAFVRRRRDLRQISNMGTRTGVDSRTS